MPPEQNLRPRILYSCYVNRSREGEQFITDHIFSLQVSGSLRVSDGKHTFSIGEGDFRLSRRNQLAKYLKLPPAGGEFRSVSICLDQETLRQVAEAQADVRVVPAPALPPVIPLKDHPLYRSFMESLRAYLLLPVPEQAALAAVKVKEAILLLLKVNPEVRAVLFDFSEPGKIDLEAFMNRNFHFNVDLKRFAYLTGRSLSTFKRDFEKIFHSTPSRWLLQRRLQEAHFLIRDKGRRVSDVYIDVGFGDLSHFSHAFKKQYGRTPSSLKP